MHEIYQEQSGSNENAWLNDRHWGIIADKIFPQGSQELHEERIKEWKKNALVGIRAQNAANALANLGGKPEEEVAKGEERILNIFAKFLKEEGYKS